jgi:hypothetical protein
MVGRALEFVAHPSGEPSMPTPVTLEPATVAATPAPRGTLNEPSKVGFFEQQWPIAVILGSFLAVTLPVAVMVATGLDQTWLGWVYFWVFGATHLVLTVTIYCTRSNLRHFNSSWRNRTVFLAVPAGILLMFGVIHGFQLATSFPIAVALVYAGVRLFNFLHLTRQTYGVYQLFKARTRSKFPPWTKQAENAAGFTLVGALFMTHLSGGWCPLLMAGGPMSVASVTPLYSPQVDLIWLQLGWLAFVAVSVGLTTAAVWVVPGTAKGWSARSYLIGQTASTLAAAVFLPLYLAALAVHYVEYHILMWPRVFRLPLDPTSRLDRGYGWVRSRPVLFYALLLLVAAGVMRGMDAMAPQVSVGSFTGLMVLFDACVLGHYFLEMFIWKFSDPHFRRTLSELYFAPKTVS